MRAHPWIVISCSLCVLSVILLTVFFLSLLRTTPKQQKPQLIRTSGILYFDTNSNGKKDEGEQLAANTTLYVYFNKNLPRGNSKIITTDDTGNFSFSDSYLTTHDYAKFTVKGFSSTSSPFLSIGKSGYQLGITPSLPITHTYTPQNTSGNNVMKSQVIILRHLRGCNIPSIGCLDLTLDNEEVTYLTQEARAYEQAVNQWSEGKFSVELDVTVVDEMIEADLDKVYDGYWLSPDKVSLKLKHKVKPKYDFIFLAHTTFDSQSEKKMPLPACELAGGIVGGAGYIWIPKTQPAEWFECASKQTYTHGWLHQVDWALLQYSGIEDIYVEQYPNLYPQSLCNNHNADTYKWFPNVDHALQDPDFDACDNHYGTTYEAWLEYCDTVKPDNCDWVWNEHVVRKHFPPNITFIGSHCHNGIEDWGEQGIDAGSACLTEPILPSPTSTPTPSPSPTVTPPLTNTPTPTQSSLIIGTGSPSLTSPPHTPTSTPLQSTATPTHTPIPIDPTTFSITAQIPGVGTATGDNSLPKHTTREIEVVVYDTQNKKISGGIGTATYEDGVYKGEVVVPNVPTGKYIVKVRLENTLPKETSKKALSITAGQTVTLPSVHLISGDIDNNGVLNLVDYNLFVSCFGNKLCKYKAQSDLNDDGFVEEKDNNILLYGFATSLL